jgi:hypothetical protein
MMQPRRRRPIRRPALGFSSVLEAEKNEQRQDNAFREVTAKAPFGFNFRFFKSQK